MEYMIIAGFVAAVDRLEWAVFGRIWKLIPPKGGNPWLQAVWSGIGGVIGAFAITRLTGQTDLFTAVVGAFIVGRIVGGIIDTVVDAPRQ
jgi:hypothetical protein